MHHPSVKHTLSIFEKIYKDLPPLVPAETRRDMENALESIRHNFSITLSELEEVMISFAKRVWPYRQAFFDFLKIYESRLGEKTLWQKMTAGLKKKYDLLKVHGVSFADLNNGGPLHMFTPEERVQLITILFDVKKDIHNHTVQAVLSTDQPAYEARICQFCDVMDEIEERLKLLRAMADKEQDHPDLADEIREQVRAYEHGLSLLGPTNSFEAICKSHEHFIGRKKDKVQHRVL